MLSTTVYRKMPPPIAADDHVLAARVSRALHNTGNVYMRCVNVAARGGFVRLEGSVSSYYLKQLAQETARRETGVRGVQNHLEVMDRFARRA